MDAGRGLEEIFHYLQGNPPIDADALIHGTWMFFLQHMAVAGLFSAHTSHFCQGKCMLYKQDKFAPG